MTINLSKLHFNSALLASELLKRWINLKYLWDTNIIEAEFNWHIEIINECDLSIMPATYRTIFDNKWVTKELLNSKWFSTIRWKEFSPVDSNLALNYVKENFEYPVVIKDIHGTHWYQVKMNIYSDQEFIKAYEKLAKSSNFQVDILVEEQVFFSEFRLTVTKNWFFAAVNRQPANVVWDWKRKLKEIIDDINHNRINFRTNCLCNIWIDDELNNYLDKKWLSLDYIPKKWEKVFLRSNSNVSTWGDCIDVTDIVDDKFKTLAFKILASFDKLPYIWIDLLTRDISSFWEYYICELNPAPWISLHTHPWVWVSRDLPKALIDMLYPETIATDKIDNYNRFIINPYFKTIRELWEKFVKKYPKNYFYKPLMIELELTNVCNFRCPDCAIIEDVIKWEYGLDNDLIIKTLNEASKLWIYSYSITWGEPFMRFSDMCEIIKKVENIDCFKIQTNWSFLNTDKKANLYLKKLSESGFWQRNKYLKSSLRISSWISNSEEKNYWDKIIYSSKNYYKYFDEKKSYLWFLASDDLKNIDDTKENFIKFFEAKTNLKYDDEKYYFRPIYIHPKTLNLEKLSINDSITIKSYLEKHDNKGFCFWLNDNIPWPKILIRANGDVYSCACFSHVFLIWNIKNDSLKNIIENTNKNDVIKLISNKWLIWLLDYAEKILPWIWDKKIPTNITHCNICKILKDKIWDDVLK